MVMLRCKHLCDWMTEMSVTWEWYIAWWCVTYLCSWQEISVFLNNTGKSQIISFCILLITTFLPAQLPLDVLPMCLTLLNDSITSNTTVHLFVYLATLVQVPWTYVVYGWVATSQCPHCSCIHGYIGTSLSCHVSIVNGWSLMCWHKNILYWSSAAYQW